MNTAINKRASKLLAAVLAFLLAFPLLGCAVTNDDGGDPTLPGTTQPLVEDKRNLTPQEFTLASLCATDDFGREIVPFDTIKTDKERLVGLFYFVWLGQHINEMRGVYDISALEKSNPEAIFATTHADSPRQQYHFWGEPLYGYYNSLDPWVIAKHLELFIYAGVDYLALDATNSFIYAGVVTKLLNQLNEYKEQGWNVPKIMFYTNSASGNTVTRIYEQFYRNDAYQDLWLRLDGEKPAIVGYTENNTSSDQTYYAHQTDYVSADDQAFFDVFEAQWPNHTPKDIERGFPWLSWQHPQTVHNGLISVSVGQHSLYSTTFSDERARGRGYVEGEGNDPTKSHEGRNFQQQWDTAFTDDTVNNVFITGWNEWIAIKLVNSSGTPYYVDCFNEDRSRDIEMMKGGYGDSFYMQMTENIRRFKYTPAKRYKMPEMKIDITDANMAQWQFVKTHYKDIEGETFNRSFQNFAGNATYTDNTARNDLTDVKVIHDASNVYFMIRTAADITAYETGDTGFMNVKIVAGTKEFVVNRHPGTDGATSVETVSGGTYAPAGTASYKIYGNALVLSVPRAALGLTAACAFKFQVHDNVADPGRTDSFYTTGDAMPAGRFLFAYAQ